MDGCSRNLPDQQLSGQVDALRCQTEFSEGPLTSKNAQASRQALEKDRHTFFEEFTRQFFSAHGVLRVNELERNKAIASCRQLAQHAALACMDAIVPIEGLGERTHHAVRHSQMVPVNRAPHGLNVSHAQAFNEALLSFLRA